MAHLFSQIPFQVLTKAGCAPPEEERPFKDVRPPRDVRPPTEGKPKSVAFADVSSAKQECPGPPRRSARTLKDIKPIEIDSEDEVIPRDNASSTTEEYDEEGRPKAVLSDAITQTISKQFQDRGTQTDESLITRPLTDNDVQRLNMQTYAPIMPIPRHHTGCGPPLRIGLTLRGKKRKVFYPDDDAENRSSFID